MIVIYTVTKGELIYTGRVPFRKPVVKGDSGGDLPGVYGRKFAFVKGSLYIFVSEYVSDAGVEVRDLRTGGEYGFTLERELTVMFAADHKWHLISIYRPGEVSVHAVVNS